MSTAIHPVDATPTEPDPIDSPSSIVAILDNVGHAITLYDKDLRLVHCNQAYLDLYGLARSDIPQGLSYGELIRLLAARGEYGDKDVEALIASRAERNLSSSDSFHIRHRPNGTTISIVSKRLPNGGRLNTITEITNLRRTEEALNTKTALLQMTQDHMAQGILVCDHDLKFINFNARWVEMFNLPPEIARIGASYEEFFRFRALRGDFGPGDADELVRARRAGIGIDEPYYDEAQTADGRVVAIRRMPSPGGGIIATYTDVTDQKKAEREVDQKKILLESIVEKMAHAFVLFDFDRRIMLYNQHFKTMFGFPPGFLKQGLHIDEFTRFRYELSKKGNRQRQESLTEILRRGRDISERTGERRLPNGTHYIYSRTKIPEIGFVTTYTDITHIKKMEREKSELSLQLYQSQKMDSVGQLAGGIAHDFNNILMIVDGYTRVATKDPGLGEETRAALNNVLNSSAKAAALTRQLLVFSRHQPLATKVIACGQILDELEAMLRPLLGETIKLTIGDMSANARIETDTTQLTQAIVNMAINARDAMPHGGKLDISMQAVDVSQEFLQIHPHLTARKCVRIDVTDEGQGMDEDVIKCIFDPFFTTKEQGKGTGLGLAMAYGFVTQSKGAIEVRSAPGKGTTFGIYLPVSDKIPEVVKDIDARDLAAQGETILLVEDNEDVRNLLRMNLETYGYTIIVAPDALEALELEAEYDGTIDLLLSDVVMPNMSGAELAVAIQETRPDIKIVLMSGYPSRGEIRKIHIPSHFPLLQKPCSPERLARVLRDVLDGKDPAIV